MINPSGLCECGCGNTAPIASKTRSHLNHIKGDPVRFILGHHLFKHMNGGHGKHWKGGKINQGDGYIQIWFPSHPHAELKGYVLEHVFVATEALGRPLPDKACIHHINENRADNRSENLIICEDHAYHLLLHKRQRAFRACNNPDWKRCKFCKQWDSPANLYIPPSGWSAFHRRCSAEYQRRRTKRRLQ